MGARAEEAAAPGDQWYGWQTLLADASAVGLGFAVYEIGGGRASDAHNGWIAAGASWILAAPIIHAAHGSGNSAASLGLRIALPLASALAGYIVGAAAACGSSTGGLADLFSAVCRGRYAVLGGGIGVTAASLVDGFHFARLRGAGPAAPRAFMVLDPRRHMLGLGGTF